MISTKLNILSSGTIDLYSDIPVPLNYSIAELQTVDKTNSAFSKTITVPGTKNNNKLLGHLFDIGISDTFDVRVKAPCTIEVDTVELIKGDLRLVEIRRIQDDFIEYDLLIEGEVSSMFNGMSDEKVAALDFGTVIFLEQNIYSTWVADPTALTYAFPIIDFGEDSTHNIYRWDHMRPMVQARYVLQKIFEYCGYVWDSDFFDSDYFKHLFVGGITDTWCLTEAELIERRARVSVGIQYTQAMVMHTKYDIQINDDTTSPNTDPSNLFNTTTYKFAPTVSGYYQMTGSLTFDFTSYTTNTYGYRIIVNAIFTFPGFSTSFDTDIAFLDVTSSAEVTIPLVYNNYFSADGTGTNVKFQVRFVQIGSDGAAPTIRIKTTSVFDFHSSTDVNLIGETINLNKAIDPEVTMRDFFTSIIKMFNLFVEPDQDNSNKLRIEPRNDFYGSGRVIDWSDKQDRNVELSIIPTDLGVKEYTFKYAKDNDVWNEKYNKSYAREYADRVAVMNSDYNKEKKTTEIIFAPTPCVQFMNSDRVVPAIYFDDKGVNKRKPCKMRILHYAGLKTCSPAFYTNLIDGNYSQPTGTARTQYPFFGMVDDPTNPTVSLDWGVPKEIYWETVKYTDNNLYNKYYRQMLEESAHLSSRMVTGRFYLTPADIAGLDFRNTIHIDGINYRINKIIDYDPIIPRTTTVELIKIVNRQSFSTTSGTILGGGGVEFVPTPLGEALDNSEIKPVKDRANTASVDGNIYYPESGQRVSGQNNIISSSATFVDVSGISNFIGGGARYVSVVNSSGTIVGASAKNISVVNSSGVIIGDSLVNVSVVNSSSRTITESNIHVINNTFFRLSGPNESPQSLGSIKISLSAAQIKTLFSSPVDCGIYLPSGAFIQVTTAAVRFIPGGTPFDIGNDLRLITQTASNFQKHAAVLGNPLDEISIMHDENTGGSGELVADQPLLIKADADSTVGDGTAIVYINYRTVTP